MHYRTIADLNNDIAAWSSRLPEEIDVIVGIPRSGLLVANILALHLNIPFTDVEGLIAGRLLDGGKRLGLPDLCLHGDHRLRILVVDDSVWSGEQMAITRARITQARLPHDITYGAVYVMSEAAPPVDTYHSRVPVPRAFEWNILHHPALKESCVALEGFVLPRLPTGQVFTADVLRRIKPLFHPTQKIGRFVALQPESARSAIEAWLTRHGIRYESLTLIAPAGRNPDAITRDKAAVYRHDRAWIYIEARQHDAASLARIARRPVFCVETRQMLYPGHGGVTENRPSPAMIAAMRTRNIIDRIQGKIRALVR